MYETKELDRRLTVIEKKLGLVAEDKIKEYLKKNRPGYSFAFCTSNGYGLPHKCIRFSLPSSNKHGTFAIWHFVMDFVKTFPNAYPFHHSCDPTHNYQYVDISAYYEGDKFVD